MMLGDYLSIAFIYVINKFDLTIARFYYEKLSILL